MICQINYKYIKLSYDLDENTPAPAGLDRVKIKKISDILKGDISNVYQISLCNHVGTHIDGPNHFNPGKPSIDKYKIGTFIFNYPVILDIPKSDGQIILKEDLATYEELLRIADIVLIRTGFSKIRKKNLYRYEQESPGFSANAAEYIVMGDFPNLRALAIDSLSFASLKNIEEGIEAHRILMNEDDKDIFLIEDINLDFNLKLIKKVYVIPLFVKGFDSAHCTVFAEINSM
jgi:kynurenine formamidase